MTDIRRIQMARAMAGRKKRNSYTQGSKREYFFGYPTEGKGGYSDCSSAVRKAIERVTGISIGSNTVSQVNNNTTLEWVEFSNGNKYPTVPLLPGDLLYFKGKDTSRPYKVAHVEMVAEDTTRLWGHGSGIGPREINLREYCASRYRSGRGLIGVKRVLLQGESEPEDDANLGSRLLKITSPMMRGKDVRKLQEILLNVGYDSDGTDGIYGQNTHDAVRAFQYASGLTPDGIYGPMTHAALLAKAQIGDAEEKAEEKTGAEPTILTASKDTWIYTLPFGPAIKCALLKEGESVEKVSMDNAAEWIAVNWNGNLRFIREE